MNQINKGKAGCESGVCSRIATMTTALSSARDLQGKQEVPFQCVYTATQMPVSLLGVPVTWRWEKQPVFTAYITWKRASPETHVRKDPSKDLASWVSKAAWCSVQT